MKQKLLTLGILGLLISFSARGQKFVDQLNVGELMPKDIKIGGFTEAQNNDCSCRVFYIQYDNQGGQNGVQGETYGIHHQNDTIVAVIKITMRMNKTDAMQTYISRMTSFMRTANNAINRKIIAARDSKKGVVDGIYYFGYSFDNGKKYRVTGVVETTLIEETYFPKSNYKPKLTD